MRSLLRIPIKLLAATIISAGMFAAPMVQAATPDDQLIVGFSMTNVLSLDPAGISGKESNQILINVYQSLVALHPINRQQIDPLLAESWTISEDNTSITFKLAPGATFASGNPVTSADVVWSLQRLLTLNLSQASQLKTRGFSAENAVQSFAAPDPSTVVVTLPTPMDPKLIVMILGMVGPGSIIDSKTALENEVDGDLGAAWLKTNTAGSGPFVVRQFRSNDMVLLDQNENYWRDKPEMRRIVMRHLPESQSQRLQLERGDIDLAYSLAAPDLAALENNDQVEVLTSGGGGFYYLAANMLDERFADPKVRLALRYLIDYEGLNQAVMPYYGFARQRPVHEGLMGALPDPGYKLDVARAKQLLAEAGYPNGFDVTLRALSDAPFRNIATAIQSTLAQGGINASLVTGTGDQVYGAMRERNFELLVGRSGGQIPHPDYDMRSLAYNPDNSTEAQLTGMQGWRAGFFDAELNAMIDKAAVESDPAVQQELYENAQLRYEEVVPAIQPISQVSDSAAIRTDVKGLIIHPSWQTDLSVVYKER